MKGFKEFLLRGNLIQLAVAFIMGGVFAAVVKTFTDVMLDIIGKIFGTPDFSSVSVAGVSIGAFLAALVSFVLTALVVYLFVVLPYNKFEERRKAGDEPTDPTSEELLTEIRDLLASK